MKLCNLAIDRSLTVLIVLFTIVVVGSYAYVVLPRESNPEVVIPFISILVTYEGVSPEDMETLVTIPIERQLTGIADVREISSTSQEGASSIAIEFEAGTDIDNALQRVRDKVDFAKSDLPEEADDPIISELDISALPIMIVALTGDVGLAALSRFAENLQDEIEAVRGVLEVNIVGDTEREIEIEADPERIAAYGVPFSDLIRAARMENVNVPGGVLELGDASYLMRVPGEFRTPAELEGLVVKQGERGLVYLRDLADVRDTFKEATTYSRVDGRPAVTLTVAKRAGANVITIAQHVHAILEVARSRAPAGVDIVVTTDESEFVRDVVVELESGILTGLILVLVVVLLFMGLSNAVFVALAIPVSMLMTFSVLYFTGVTLNMVVLFSLILALGMLVDNGIVVVENIYRHAQQGKTRTQAAKDGAAEVALPVTAATLTTMAAFFPLFFWPGIWGSFMFYLPMTLTLVLGASLFVALVVNPALASMFMRIHPKSVEAERHRFLHAYGRVVRLALRWRAVTITVAITALAVIQYIYAAGATVEFTPSVEPPRAYIDIEAPQGTNLAASDALVRQVEARLEPYREHIDYVITNVGSRGIQFFGSGGGTTTHISRITLDFPKLEEAAVMPSVIIASLREDLRDIAGAEIRIDSLDMGPPSGAAINVEISGDDFGVLAGLAADVRAAVRDVPGLVDLHDDYDRGRPEVRVRIDREQAWRAGLSTEYAGMIIRAAIDGRVAANYREGDDEYDVMVRFPRSFREDLSNLRSMRFINEAGQAVPFSAIASVEEGLGLGSISRINRTRAITVSADASGRSAAEVLRDVQAILGHMQLPTGYYLAYTGENEEMVEAQEFLGRAFVLALLLILLILVTQFNSVLQPLVIMTAVVLSLSGVFLGLLIFNMPFGVIMTGIGCISLAGVVVNNGIVLIDFINQLRARGMALEDAIVEGAMIRFRPVMLTAITTILGLVPMAAGVTFDFRRLQWIVGGEMGQWWGSMAIAVIFGLAFATILTLVVVPTLYSAACSLSAVLSPSSDTVSDAPGGAREAS